MGFNSRPSIKRTKPSNVFGHIPGVPVNSTFENRLFLHHASVHSGILAGIYGNKHEGCYSVVLSGGYEDDRDEGYKFTYTGCGGRDRKNGEKPREGPQTCDQSWDNSRNMSLRVSSYTKKPVRVVRGYKSSSDFAPVEGYRYDGLYVVESAWMDMGKSGYQVCKYVLKRLPGQPPIPRRQGTLNLDLSEWERPIHFGKDDNDSDSDGSHSSSPKRAARKGKAKAIPLTQSGWPLIRRPKDSDTEDSDAWSDRSDSTVGPSRTRSRSASPARKILPLPSKPSPPAAIPSTTNGPLAERKPAAVPSQAPQPDVRALLAEWAEDGPCSAAVPSADIDDGLDPDWGVRGRGVEGTGSASCEDISTDKEAERDVKQFRFGQTSGPQSSTAATSASRSAATATGQVKVESVLD